MYGGSNILQDPSRTKACVTAADLFVIWFIWFSIWFRLNMYLIQMATWFKYLIQMPTCIASCGSTAVEILKYCLYYIAFYKMPKRIKLAVLSVAFKIGLKRRVLKKFINLNNRNLQFPAQYQFSAWALNCQKLNQGLWQNFQPPWPISQRLRWKNAIFICV